MLTGLTSRAKCLDRDGNCLDVNISQAQAGA